MNLSGQWIGRYTGTSNGKLIVDIDALAAISSAYAIAHPDDKQLPPACAQFDVPAHPRAFKLSGIPTYPIDLVTGNIGITDALKAAYPGTTFATSIDIEGEWTDSELSLKWKTDIGTDGSATLPKSKSSDPSEYKSEQVTWDEFKLIVSAFESRRYIFRGQRRPWRLRTAFHRTGRANLARFRLEDIPIVSRHLSGLTRHVFNFLVPDEYGSFLNLIQHHGYPTPLLDWTYSAYVAAFFAYREVTPNDLRCASIDDKVRILVFDQKAWRQTYPQLLRLQELHEHFSLLEPHAIENARMIPQQSIVSVTNVDDIETYIRGRERDQSTTFLRAFDIPLVLRNDVMRELSFMGVTAGALFPGIDGACEELRERHFRL